MNRYKKLETVLVITVGLMLFFLLFNNILFLYLALGITVLALISESLRNTIVFVWEKLAQTLGFINGRILLTLLFYFFLTPLAFMSKCFGKNKIPNISGINSSSYVTRNHLYTGNDMEKPW